MTEHLTLQGGYYEMGKQFGEPKRDAIRQVIESFRAGSFFNVIQQYLDTDVGKEVLNRFKTTTETHLPEIVRELQGVADGAAVDYNDLFLLNVANEFIDIVKSLPSHSHDVEYSAGFLGCTNIFMETVDGRVYLVHTEDVNPKWSRFGLMLTATIYDDRDKLTVLEEWTQFVIPGVLPGGTFGFNNHGLMAAHNNIYQNNINKNGIPRSFMCRSLVGSKNISEVKDKLFTEPGIASGFSFQFLHKTKDGKVENTVIEVAGGETGTLIDEFRPTGFYHHCNIYQHLRHDCHPEESSIHRAATISQYLNRRPEYTLTELKSLISNVDDKVFPIHRNGNSPDYLATSATGLYDVNGSRLFVYTDQPADSEPKHVFPIPF